MTDKTPIMNRYEKETQYFKALMHPTRLAILNILRDGEECVCHMIAFLGLRQAHVSQHLMILRDFGLVTDRRDGWNIYYRVLQPQIYQVIDAMDDFCGTLAGSRVGEKPVTSSKVCNCPKCNPGEQADLFAQSYELLDIKD